MQKQTSLLLKTIPLFDEMNISGGPFIVGEILNIE